jgi:hypothetical protein
MPLTGFLEMLFVLIAVAFSVFRLFVPPDVAQQA